MPTARELLEQADALMRRNRRSDAAVPLTPTVILPEVAAPADLPEPAGARVDERAAAGEDRDAEWLATLADLPVLTDVVEIGSAPAPVAEPAPVEEPAAVAAPVPETPPATDWSALAEEIRAQVLQRLDLFTDTGLREQLGAHLRPIVERASAELVDTINRQVGELVRRYVAEAIEREIEAWRGRNG